MATFSGDVVIAPGATGVVVHDNVFKDPDSSGFQSGVGTQAAAPSAAIVSDNTFTDLAAGILVLDGEPQISGNQFSGAHPEAPLSVGVGVLVVGGVPTITANTFGAPLGGPSAGVLVDGGLAGSPGATLNRNEISAQDVGVQVLDSTLPVTLSNDLIHGNTTGLESTDSSADTPPSTQGDVSATNETIFDNAVDASVSYTTLTLDSSILGTPIDVVGNNGACDITYSSGSPASSNGCGNFDTNAAPQFVDAASGDYQLQSTSPLIDVGDPASPGPGRSRLLRRPAPASGQAVLDGTARHRRSRVRPRNDSRLSATAFTAGSPTDTDPRAAGGAEDQQAARQAQRRHDADLQVLQQCARLDLPLQAGRRPVQVLHLA